MMRKLRAAATLSLIFGAAFAIAYPLLRVIQLSLDTQAFTVSNLLSGVVTFSAIGSGIGLLCAARLSFSAGLRVRVAGPRSVAFAGGWAGAILALVLLLTIRGADVLNVHILTVLGLLLTYGALGGVVGAIVGFVGRQSGSNVSCGDDRQPESEELALNATLGEICIASGIRHDVARSAKRRDD